MAIDARSVVTFGFYPTSATQFYDRVMTFGWWEGFPIIIPPGTGGNATQLTLALIGRIRV